MSDEQAPERPPTSGPGSGVEAWRAYAAAVTGSPTESWESLSRDEIVELLESEGAEAVSEEPAADDPAPAPEQAEPRRRRPEWMVPTADGWVPAPVLRRR